MYDHDPDNDQLSSHNYDRAVVKCCVNILYNTLYNISQNCKGYTYIATDLKTFTLIAKMICHILIAKI